MDYARNLSLRDAYPSATNQVAGGGTPFDRKRLEVELDRARLYQRECEISIEEHQDETQRTTRLQAADSPDWHALRTESLTIERDGAALNVRRLELNLREFDYWADMSKVKAGAYYDRTRPPPASGGAAMAMVDKANGHMDEATGLNSGLGSVV